MKHLELIIAVARTVGGLEELDDQIKASGGLSTVLVPLDISDEPALSRLGAAIHERWGRLDLWLHAAVQAPMLSPAEHIDGGELDKAIAVNIRAFQRLIRVLDPLLRVAPAGRAVLAEDPMTPTAYNSAYVSVKAAQKIIAQAWGDGLAATGNARLVRAILPPMATALRARFHPGEDTSAMARPKDVAARLLSMLADGGDGPFDLSKLQG